MKEKKAMEELRVDMRERDAYDLEIYAKHEELEKASDAVGWCDVCKGWED